MDPDSPLAAPSSPPAPALPLVPWERVDTFIGNFTHDLRNGLNAMELQLTLLGEMNQDETLDEDIRSLRATLAHQSRDMQAVRTAAGPVSLHTLRYPASDLLEDLRERQEKRAAGAIRWPDAPASLAGLTLAIDPELLLGSLLHLFENAVQFRARPDTALAFAAATVADPFEGLRLEITEEKAGPPPAGLALDAWGAEPLRSTRRGGYGLGLFRARRALEAQGGTLRARWPADPPHALVSSVWLPAATV